MRRDGRCNKKEEEMEEICAVPRILAMFRRNGKVNWNQLVYRNDDVQWKRNEVWNQHSHRNGNVAKASRAII